MDKYAENISKMGQFHILQARGGMVTVRERPALSFGEKSLVKNVRCWHPGYETRKGYTKLNTTAYNASSDSPLNMFQFVKGKISEKRFFVQFGDGDLKEATNAPPATGTTFGSTVHDGSSGQLPAAFAVINDYMVYSNGADQHQIYAGQTQDISAFVLVKDSAAHDLFPGLGLDYSDVVVDGDSTTVAALDSMDDYTNGFDAIYVMTKTPADLFNITVSAANSNASALRVDYWNGAWTNDSITDNTSSGGATLAKSGTVVFDTTSPNRTDEIPRMMFNQSGFWYRIYLEDIETSSSQDLTTYTEVDSAGDLTVTSTKVDFDTMQVVADAYLYKDFGAGYFGDFDIDFEAEITASATGSIAVLIGIGNTAGSRADWESANDGMFLYALNNAGNIELWLKCSNTDNLDSYTPAAGSTMALRYFSFKRSGTTLTLEIYSDSSRTVLVDTLTVTSESGTKRYLHAVASRDSVGTATITGYTQNFSEITSTSSSLDAETEISEMTYDCESFVDLVNVWNGIPSDLIEAHFYDDSESQYDLYATTAITLDDMTSSDYLFLASDDQLEAIYFDFGNTPNTNGTPTISIEYWDGDSWSGTTETDGTGNFTESGWIWFGRQTDEQKQQFRNTKYYAYWYRISVSTTLSDDVVVGVFGMPYFDINKLGKIGRVSATWKNRALYTFNKFPRDIYVSEAGEHMKLNGSDYALLQPGDGRDNATVAIVNFHNEIMVFQEEKGPRGGCVTIFEGYSPATFGKLVLSTQVGTFSPKSVDVVDGSKVSTTKRDLNSQTQVFFLSHYGVFMSDGRIVTAISDDIQNYFDPRFSECLRRGYEDECWLKYDSSENVIKIGIVSGSSATTANKYFVYDLTDGVWYEDDYASEISVFSEVEADSGQYHTVQVAAGATTGFIYHMNNGTNDDDTAISAEMQWEFNNGPFFIDIEEILSRVKVQGDGKTYSWAAEENDKAFDSGTGSMAAKVSGYTMRRNRHLKKVSNTSWTSFKITSNTKDVPIYLYDLGIISYSKEFK